MRVNKAHFYIRKQEAKRKVTESISLLLELKNRDIEVIC